MTKGVVSNKIALLFVGRISKATREYFKSHEGISDASESSQNLPNFHFHLQKFKLVLLPFLFYLFLFLTNTRHGYDNFGYQGDSILARLVTRLSDLGSSCSFACRHCGPQRSIAIAFAKESLVATSSLSSLSHYWQCSHLWNGSLSLLFFKSGKGECFPFSALCCLIHLISLPPCLLLVWRSIYIQAAW